VCPRLWTRSQRATLDERVKRSGRHYAATFRTSAQRLKPLANKTAVPDTIGPGSFSLPHEATYTGLKRQLEPFRPSSVFAPRCGGKFANVGDSPYW
jgi:hypothetical protein